MNVNVNFGERRMNVMIDLFVTFAPIGCFTFGRVCGSIPFIRDVVLKKISSIMLIVISACVGMALFG